MKVIMSMNVNFFKNFARTAIDYPCGRVKVPLHNALYLFLAGLVSWDFTEYRGSDS
jgi:hypothetical protein